MIQIDCRNNHLNSGKRTENKYWISIMYIAWGNWDGNSRTPSHSTLLPLTHTQLIQTKHDLQQCYSMCAKNFWFHSTSINHRRVLVGLRSFERFSRDATFPLRYPWFKNDWDELTFRYNLLILYTSLRGNGNYYFKYDFEKSRKHSFILRNTTGLNGLFLKKNIYPAKKGWNEWSNIYSSLTFSIV